MDARRISKEYGECYGQRENVGDHPKRARTMQSHPMPEHRLCAAPVMDIQPVEVYVLVHDQDLGWNPRGRHPFPFGHDRVASAEHAHG